MDGTRTATPGSERPRYRRQFIASTPSLLLDEQQSVEVLQSTTAARAAARMALLKVTHAFYTWQRASSGAATWRESAQAQALLAQAQRLVRNRTLRHFRAWLGYLISLRQEWIAEEHMLAATMLKPFLAWAEIVARSSTLRDGMMNLCLRRAVWLLRMCLEQLANHSAARRFRRARFARAVRCFCMRTMDNAFAGWADAVREHVIWREQALLVAWTRWKELARRSAYVERRACELLLRRTLRLMLSAFRRWVEWSHLHRCMAVAVAEFHGKRKENIGILALNRWKQYTARSCRNAHALARVAFATRLSKLREIWGLWNELSRLQLLRRRKMLAGLYRRQLYAGFHGWLEYCRRHEDQQRKLKKVAAYLRRSLTATAWRSWLDFTKDAVYTRGVWQWILGIMMNKQLHRALKAWMGAAFIAKSTRSVRKVKLHRARAKLKHKLLVFSWHRWTERIRCNHERAKKLLFVITRLRWRSVSLSFASWVQQWEWQRWAQEATNSALSRMSNKLVNCAYNAWLQLVFQRRCLRHVIRKMQHRQNERLLPRAFRHYRAVVLQNVTVRKQDEAYLAQHAEALVMANRRLACRRMLRTLVGEWAYVVARRRSRTRLAQRAVNAMVRRALSTAFLTWSSFALCDPRDLKIERLQETIVLLHMRDCRRAYCIDVFKTWLLYIEDQWEQRNAVKQSIDNLALELAIQTETEGLGAHRKVSSLRY